MDAAQIEKMKALALAATQGEWKLADNGWIDGPGEDNCVVQYEGCGSHAAYWDENDLKFVLGCGPAAVLELIAEVERLRAEKEVPDSSHVIPSMRGDEKSVEAAIQRAVAEILSGWDTSRTQLKARITREIGAVLTFDRAINAEAATRCRAEGGDTSDKSSELSGSAPAAGTEKDAERLVPRTDDFGTVWMVTPEKAAEIDAAIGAHTKAGTDSGTAAETMGQHQEKP